MAAIEPSTRALGWHPWSSMNSGMSFGPILPQRTAASVIVQPGIRTSTPPLRAETVGIGSPGRLVAQSSTASWPQDSLR